jgi:N-terminal domain of NWD NACHT-NTPase
MLQIVKWFRHLFNFHLPKWAKISNRKSIPTVSDQTVHSPPDPIQTVPSQPKPVQPVPSQANPIQHDSTQPRPFQPASVLSGHNQSNLGLKALCWCHEDNKELWDRAYLKIGKTDPKLVEAYEDILSRVGKDHLITGSKWEQMGNLVHSGLQEAESLKRARKLVGTAGMILTRVKSMGDAAVQANPIAALAWAGVCFVLEVCHFCYLLSNLLTALRYCTILRRNLRLIARALCTYFSVFRGTLMFRIESTFPKILTTSYCVT